MKITQHLQFLLFMIPTMLLLAAMVFTLAFPTADSREPAPAAGFAQEYSVGQEDPTIQDTETDPDRDGQIARGQP